MNVAAVEMAGQEDESDDFLEPTASHNENLLSLTEQALTATPNPCKQMLVMFYFDRMPLEQIAGHLGFANANVAKASKARCFKKLVELVRTLQLKKLNHEKVK